MDPMCLTYGFIISIVVSFLKRWPWAANNPKVIASIVSSVFAFGSLFAHGGAAMTMATVQTLVTCITAQLAASVATHEIVVQPVKDFVVNKLTNG